jgi:hypothetical protein
VLGHGWQMQWGRVHRRLNDLRTAYTGRPGGTPAAVDATQSFFEAGSTSRTGSGMTHQAG